MKLSPCIRQFFDQYLPHIKGVSEHTLKAYRDAFRLFLPFAAKFYGIKIKSLRVEHLSSVLIIAFLEDLQKERKIHQIFAAHGIRCKGRLKTVTV